MNELLDCRSVLPFEFDQVFDLIEGPEVPARVGIFTTIVVNVTSLIGQQGSCAPRAYTAVLSYEYVF